MSRRKQKTPPRPPIPGTVHANIQLPEHLHEAMKVIRQARHESEGADVKLCRIYREAVEQYVNSKPQQQLLTANGHISKSLRTAV
jgi:hypothetical protein